MARNAQKPYPKRGNSAETVQVLPCRNEDFLDQILYEIDSRRQSPLDKRVDCICVGVDKLRSCFSFRSTAATSAASSDGACPLCRLVQGMLFKSHRFLLGRAHRRQRFRPRKPRPPLGGIGSVNSAQGWLESLICFLMVMSKRRRKFPLGLQCIGR
jgi:hypothetical protein